MLTKDNCVALATAHGAKLDRADNGMWRVLDQPDTVFWWAWFLGERSAAYAYCLHHGLTGEAND